jgi:hypothetical protein
MYKTLLPVLAALCLCQPAQAITLGTSTLNGNAVDTSFSTSSLLTIDLTFINALPVGLSFTIDADDIIAGGIDFNAIVREVSGSGIGSLSVTTGGAPISLNVGTTRAATVTGDLLSDNFFAGAPVAEFYLGNPFFDDGLIDWRIGFAGLSAGDRFTLDLAITPSVPEPREWMMMLGGLGMILLSAIRQRGR